jgi:hypothetical protein
VAEVADVRIVVAAPGLGDGIQVMKSGFLEIAARLASIPAQRRLSVSPDHQEARQDPVWTGGALQENR